MSSFARAISIVTELPAGLSIDSQTLMQRAVDGTSDTFDAAEADRLATFIKDDLPGLEVIDAGEAGYQRNIHFWVRNPA
jgi:hypothetical protein